MPRIPFIGATYTLASIRAECQRCLNYFPEMVESGVAPNGEKGYLVQAPGLRLLTTVGTGPIRATYWTSTGRLVVVSGNAVYRVDPGYVSVLIGNILTNSDFVDIADNGLEVMIVDGTACYIVSITTGVFQVVAGLPGANRVAFLDGYFVINNPGTGQFIISALNDGLTWDTLLDAGTAEGLPDNTVGLLVNQRQLWVFGEQSVEVYWNSGDPTFPISRVDGSFIEYGCAAAGTIQKLAGCVVWVTDNGQVMMNEGYNPKRISNFAVEQVIHAAGDISTATAFTYKQNGHMFYVLQLPNTTTTWVFDVATGQWHERCELINGNLAPWRASSFADAWDDKLVGDSTNGKLYAMDFDVFTNAGDVLYRQRRSPHITADLNRLCIDKFQLDMEGGQGLDGTTLGTDPQVMLRVSRDAGYTWGSERWTTLGGLGRFRTRALWRQLGQARDWVFEITITDPVKATILGALIDARGSVS